MWGRRARLDASGKSNIYQTFSGETGGVLYMQQALLFSVVDAAVHTDRVWGRLRANIYRAV